MRNNFLLFHHNSICRRMNILDELLSTETKYVQDIESILSGYKDVLENSFIGFKSGSKRKVKVVKLNIFRTNTQVTYLETWRKFTSSIPNHCFPNCLIVAQTFKLWPKFSLTTVRRFANSTAGQNYICKTRWISSQSSSSGE